VATISAASVIFGGIAAGNVGPTLFPSLIIFVAITAREVLKTMADYEGDLRQQCRTVATVFGKRVSRSIFYVIALGAGAVMSLPYLLDLYRPVYAYLVCFGVYPVLFYVLWRVTRDMSPAHLNHLSRLMKLDFVIFFFAVVLGAA
jgi:geranylgeranylglycerol-phosphate geranylgeranyltransferase